MGNYFTPSIGARKTLSVTGASSSVTIAAGDGDTLVLSNTGANTAYLRWGAGAQTAVTTDFPLLAGSSIAVGAASSVSATVVAAITASSTTTVEVSPGRGTFSGFANSGAASVSVTGAVTAVGTVAEDSSVSAVAPVIAGGIVRTSDPTAMAANDGMRLTMDQLGKALFRPYALPSNTWTAVLDTAITDTTSTAVKTAGGANVKYYITSATISNAHATVGTDVLILSGTTKLWIVPAAAVYGGACITFPVPLPCGANEAINFQPKTTGASIKGAVAGYSETI